MSGYKSFLRLEKIPVSEYVFKISVDHLKHGVLTYLEKIHLFYFGIKLVKTSHHIDSDKA